VSESVSGSESRRGLSAAAPESAPMDASARASLLPSLRGSSVDILATQPLASSIPTDNIDPGVDILVAARTHSPFPRSSTSSRSSVTNENHPVTYL
jgi:hypothetical protein